MDHRFDDVAEVRDKLASVDYLADDAIAGVVHLSDRLEKPIRSKVRRVPERRSSQSLWPR